MSAYLGDFLAGATVRFLWSTNDGAGASVTRTVNGTISIYKNNGTTQDTDGVTDTEDFDSLTGIHACAIDLSADGAFYSVGADFAVVLSGSTIDGQTVNAVLREFSIENRFGTLKTGAITAAVVADNAIDAGAIAAGAITAAKFAAGAIDAAAIADNAIDAGALAADAITAAKIATGAITAAKFAAGAIDAAAIATDAIGSAEISAAAVTKIQAGLATAAAVSDVETAVGTRLATSGYTTPPTAVQNADALLARSIIGGANGGRDVKDALKRLRNHVGVVLGTMTVYEADDTTPAWTAALTTAAGNPVSDVNPT